ncbi:MAG TPA: hypothetical protein VLK79_09850 [Gaiellales bacterium]|nr:hypothetical protein [Gaiellales bacterium]
MDDLRRRLIGAWRVRRYDDRDSIDDEWTETYGPDVDGLIVYHESGWLTVSVAGGGGKLDSYFGRFEVVEISEEHGAVTGVLNHLIVASSLPELLNADPARPFRVSGDALVLGDETTWRRICERVG